MVSKKVLITGASRGIGKAIACLLLEHGYSVIGTSRNPDSIERRVSGIEYVQLDLSDEKSIDLCIRTVGPLDVLINNAGESQIGPVEETPLEKYRELFQVNLFGTIQLTQGFLPAMIENGRGCIINIGSMAGKFAVPFQSSYVSSKFALSGFTWSLRNEVERYGVNVVMVEPNDIKTEIQPVVIHSEESRYREELNRMMAARAKSMANAVPADVVAQKVVRILKKKNPRPYFTVGGIGPFFVFLKRFLPDSLVESLVRGSYDL